MTSQEKDDAYEIVSAMKALLQGYIKGVDLPESFYDKIAEHSNVKVSELSRSLDNALQLIGKQL